MLAQAKKPPAREARTGYGLHADRLSFWRKPAIRSVKFPLVVKDKKVLDDFCGEIQHDYINCVGDLTFSDWYENVHLAKKPTYSVLDFWLDSLRTGVVFFPKENDVRDFLETHRGNNPKNAFRKHLFQDDVMEHYIDFDKAYQEATKKNSRPGQKSKKEQLEAFYRRVVKKEFRREQPREALALVRRLFEQDTFRKETAWRPLTQKKSGYKSPFLIFPDIPFAPNLPAQGLLERACARASYHGVVSKDGLLRDLGLFNKQAAFSNYFNEALNDIRDNTEVICSRIKEAFSLWKGKEEELLRRIDFLSAQAKKLKEPDLANHWGEYRNFFGGKIESWVSNYLRQKTDITGKGKINKKTKEPEKGEITLHQEDIENALKLDWIRENPVLAQELKNLRAILDGAYDAKIDKMSNMALEVYRRELAGARSALNEAYQEQFHNVSDNEEDNEDKQAKDRRANTDLPHLFKDIKQLPEFVGDAKKKQFEQFLDAPKTVRICFEKLSAFEKARLSWKARAFNANDTELTKRTLERLRVKHYGRGYGKSKSGKPWHDSGFNGARFRDLVGAFFARHKLTDALKQSRPLFKSRFARNKEPVFTNNEFLNRLDEKQSGQLLTAFVNECAPRWRDIRNKYDLTDALWLEKVRAGVIVALAELDSFSLSDIGGLGKEEKNELKELHLFLSLLKKDAFTKDEFGRILQGYILAPATGAVMQLGRETYMERYCVLPLNTEQNYQLCYRLVEKEKKEWGILLDKRDIQKKKDEGVKERSELFLKRKNVKDFASEKEYQLVHLSDNTCFANLHTSPYQMQFINKALDGKESWYAKRKLAADLSSYSFIVEEPVRLDWDIVQNIVSLKRSGEKRLFVSIPFNLQATGKIDAVAMGRTIRGRRIMGIDVGEYGVAYVILEHGRNNGNVRVRAHDFIKEPLIHTIREFVGTLKNRQARGTFGMPSTKLARIRENAITSLRNQIHDVALRYNAEPVYEFEISGFEAGSGKVKRIYNSVKTADVYAENKAEESERFLVWGKKAGLFGSEVGADATSYICLKCGYSPYKGHNRDSDSEKKLLKEEKEKARPSLEQFLRLPEAEVFERNRLEAFTERRGNSAIYNCPNCHFKTDADIQAAYWIGLKKLLKERKKREEKVSVEELVTFHQKNKVPPFSLQDILAKR